MESSLKVHFVNTGPDFPYAYYLGITSAVQVFGDRCRLWLAETPTGKYFDLVQDKLKITKLPSPPAFPMLEGRGVRFTRVSIFDYWAWVILANEGGTIMGLDSFTLTDFHGLLAPDKEMLVGLDAYGKDSFCMHGATVQEGSSLTVAIHEDSVRALRGVCPSGRHDAIRDGKLRFGGAGIIPFLNHALANWDRLSVADFGLLSGFHNRGALHPACQTIPFYATSDKKLGTVTPDRIASGRSKIAEVVKTRLTAAVWDPPLATGYRFHLLGLVHLPISETFMGCAFTQKILKMSKMLLSLGHEVFLYGAEGSDAPCTEFVQTHSMRAIRSEWGEGDNRPECDGLGYQWRRVGFRHDFNETRTETTKRFYEVCIGEIGKRARRDDFLLIQGVYHRPVAKAVKLWLTCEPGVGYHGSYAKYRAFESAYLRNFTYGSQNTGDKCINGNWYDRVIPNYFDEKDFMYRADKEDYFLFVGRLIKRKGVQIAVKVADELGVKLILAGQGDMSINSPNCEFVGYVDPPERDRLMGGARAVFVPTLYLEAFGGVNIEAHLTGTPTLTTDFGVFPETNVNGLTGFRCNTLQDFVDGALAVDSLDPAAIRKHGERYLMTNVRWEFQRWFDDLHALWESAFVPGTKGWHRLRPEKGDGRGIHSGRGIGVRDFVASGDPVLESGLRDSSRVGEL